MLYMSACCSCIPWCKCVAGYSANIKIIPGTMYGWGGGGPAGVLCLVTQTIPTYLQPFNVPSLILYGEIIRLGAMVRYLTIPYCRPVGCFWQCILKGTVGQIFLGLKLVSLQQNICCLSNFQFLLDLYNC
jgi:hypothetical protein